MEETILETENSRASVRNNVSLLLLFSIVTPGRAAGEQPSDPSGLGLQTDVRFRTAERLGFPTNGGVRGGGYVSACGSARRSAHAGRFLAASGPAPVLLPDSGAGTWRELGPPDLGVVPATSRLAGDMRPLSSPSLSQAGPAVSALGRGRSLHLMPGAVPSVAAGPGRAPLGTPVPCQVPPGHV